MSRPSFVLNFREIGPDARSEVGGKGANLGILANAGFPVPDGFCITTAGFGQLLSSNNLEARISALAKNIDFTDPVQTESLTAQIRTMLISATISPDVEDAILAAYGNLGTDCLVAVRSSGTAEDLPGASFAGQHDTYLGIRGHVDLIDAVKRCWASVWTARAAAYRNANGFGHNVLIAVVIQRMVNPTTSGVLFTADPLLATEREFLINASWGLGEAIVSGIVDPDEISLDRATGDVRNFRIGTKKIALERGADGVGVVSREVAEDERARLCLSNGELGLLHDLAKRVEGFYGAIPQDIEWAIEDSKVFLLQSREITASHFAFEADLERWQADRDDDPEIVWSRSFADEYWTGAVSPLFYSIRAEEVSQSMTYAVRAFGYPCTNRKMLRYYKGKPYVNLDMYRQVMTSFIPQEFREAGLTKFPVEMRDEIANHPFSVCSLISGYRRHIEEYPLSSFMSWFDGGEAAFKKTRDLAAEILKQSLPSLDDDMLVELLAQAMRTFCEHVQAITPGLSIYMSNVLASLGTMLKLWYADERGTVLGDLMAGMPGPTSIENRELWELSRAARGDPAASALFGSHNGPGLFAALRELQPDNPFLLRVDVFIGEHAHRGHADRDFIYPRWGEDLDLFQTVLGALVRIGDEVDPHAAEVKSAEKRERLEKDIVATFLQQPFGMLKAEAFRFMLAYSHRALFIRDEERFEIDRLTFAKKKIILDLARRLKERGLIVQEQDLYFLSKDEAIDLLLGRPWSGLDQRKLDSRKWIFDNYKNEFFPPMIRNNRPLLGDEQDDSDGIRGHGTSPGRVEGVAKVITDLNNIGRLNPGDILVTNATDPGWTSAFLLIGGLVLETGGVLAHGSVLSREYGLPAVTSIEAATKRIPDGVRIRVDGDKGIVSILEGGSEGSVPMRAGEAL